MTVEDPKPAFVAAVAAPIMKLCALKWAGLTPSDLRWKRSIARNFVAVKGGVQVCRIMAYIGVEGNTAPTAKFHDSRGP